MYGRGGGGGGGGGKVRLSCLCPAGMVSGGLGG